MRIRHLVALTPFLFPLACTSESGDPPVSTGGTLSAVGGTVSGVGGVTSGGTPNTGGATPAGGTASGGAAAGGGAAGGATPVGGSASGGEAAGGAATGGAAAGGTSSSGGAGNTVEPKPSAGCSKGSAQVTIANALVGLPTGYDGSTPVPAVFAFHAAGNNNTQLKNEYGGGDLGKNYLMVYLAATGNEWKMDPDEQRYLAAWEELKANACIDENRVYATGHSSGAQMIVQLLCKGSADFDAIAPVASSVYCNSWKNGAVPALVIHGTSDQERTKYGLNDGDGKKDLASYTTSNTCTATSAPSDIDTSGCNGVNGLNGQPFTSGCVEFEGCSERTLWCNHNDPDYSNTNHGIPCFASAAIFDFFESRP